MNIIIIVMKINRYKKDRKTAKVDGLKTVDGLKMIEAK